MKNRFKIGPLISGGIITNYFCTSRCRHCLYNCSPEWPKEYMTPETAEKNLKLVREMGCTSVHIGGGEPLLRPDKLGQILDTATRVGISVEYAETNSSWFRDTDSARNILSDLKKRGLERLLISISPFHNEFIPFSKVIGVIEVCKRTGVDIYPWSTGFMLDLRIFDHEVPHKLEEFRKKFGEDYLSKIPNRYWIHFGGRALDTFRPILLNKSFRQILDENPEGCARELSDTSHFHIDLFGNYIPGLCSGLSVNADDLGKPLSEQRYPIINRLFYSGIRGILDLARENFGYRPARDGYINKCDLCSEIRAFLVRHDFGEHELNPKEFYHQQI